MFDELRDLVANTVAVASSVTDADTAWTSPWADSPAGIELAAEEARRPEPQSGSWPWLAALLIGRWALQVTIEVARRLPALLVRDTTSYAADLLCRGVLETSSLAWWLLEPDIGPRRRLARSLVYRLHTARQTEKAVKALELGPDEEPTGYGESVTDVEDEVRELGWTLNGTSVSFDDVKESWPSYTERSAKLVENIWPQRKLPYAVLSAVAHGELLGMQRSLTQVDADTSMLRPAPGPHTVLWLWHDTYLVLGALVFSTDRAAGVLGLHDQLTSLDNLREHLNQRLPSLRPTAS